MSEHLEKLAEILSEAVERMGSKHRIPNIAEASIAIEHKKYDLAKLLDKDSLLVATNMGLVLQINIYSALRRLLDKDNTIEEIEKEMHDALRSSLKSLVKLMKEIEEKRS